jgi:hypothetical protein
MEINYKYKLKTSNYIRAISDKRQIVLGNTYNYGLNHIIHTINRNAGTYNKCPHFTILKSGLVYQHFETKFYSNYLDNEYSKDIISIALENIGEIFEDNGNFFDIYNNKYNEVPFEKKWKNCNHFDKYTEEQFTSCINLCKFLLKETTVEKNVVPTNVQKNDISNFKGVCYRSNYDSKHYDLNPSWDFEKFKTEIEENG